MTSRIRISTLALMIVCSVFAATHAWADEPKVMEEINVAVFTFDGEERLKLVNRAGERLLAQPAAHLLQRSVAVRKRG